MFMQETDLRLWAGLSGLHNTGRSMARHAIKIYLLLAFGVTAFVMVMVYVFFGSLHRDLERQQLEQVGIIKLETHLLHGRRDPSRRAAVEQAIVELLESPGDGKLPPQQRLQARLDNQQQHMNFLNRRITVWKSVIVLCLIVVGLVLIALYRRLIPPLHALRRAVYDLHEGSGDLTKRLPVMGEDEIGKTVLEFNEFITLLHSLISDVVHAIERVSTAVKRMTAVSEESSSQVLLQQSETDQVATAMNEMSASVADVARNAEGAADAARKADQEAKHGTVVVHEGKESIMALADEVAATADVIQELKSNSDNIGGVLDVIKSIAEQTNLLALNAAIEAARAGAEGRGFAVVAGEVRTLAQRTQQSTEEIHEIIQTFKHRSEDAVAAMERSKGKAGQSVAHADRAYGSLQAITQSVTLISDMNSQIAASAVQQQAASEEVNRNVVNIAGVADHSAKGAQQIIGMSSELTNLVGQLEFLISCFRVK